MSYPAKDASHMGFNLQALSQTYALAGAVVHMDTDQVLLSESDAEHLEALDAFLARRGASNP